MTKTVINILSLSALISQITECGHPELLEMEGSLRQGRTRRGDHLMCKLYLNLWLIPELCSQTSSSLATDERTELRFELFLKRHSVYFESSHMNCLLKQKKSHS